MPKTTTPAHRRFTLYAVGGLVAALGATSVALGWYAGRGGAVVER